MPDNINSAVTSVAPAFLQQPLDRVQDGHANRERFQETLAQRVEAAIVTLDTAPIESLALGVLGQAEIKDDPDLRVLIGTRVAELLKGISPARAEAPKLPRGGPPAERLFDISDHGLDESSTLQRVQANADHLDRLQARQGCDPEADLRPGLDAAMKEAVQRWRNDQSVSADMLALLPGMIRCGLAVDQIDTLIHTPSSITRLHTAFGPQARTPMRIDAGLFTALDLYEWVNDGGILDSRNGNLPTGTLKSLGPSPLHTRPSALHKEGQGRMNPLREEAQARIAADLRLASLGPLAEAWMVTAPSTDAQGARDIADTIGALRRTVFRSSEDAASSSPLLWKLLPFRERLERWTGAGMSTDQQYWAGRFLVHGLDESSALQIVQANAAHPDRLQAWQGCDPGMDLRPWLDGAMKEAVQRWLNDQSVSADILALLPGMIRCGLAIDQIDALIHTPPSITRLETVFGPQARTPTRIGAGLLTALALYEWVNDGGISEDELEEAAHEAEQLSRLRRAASHARDQLRTRLNAMEAIRAVATPGTPAVRQCDGWIQLWRGASDTLGELLQSPLEDRLRDNPGEVEETLSNVFRDLALGSVEPAEPPAVDGAALRV
jgi:hypothetical protein